MKWLLGRSTPATPDVETRLLRLEESMRALRDEWIAKEDRMYKLAQRFSRERRDAVERSEDGGSHSTSDATIGLPRAVQARRGMLSSS